MPTPDDDRRGRCAWGPHLDFVILPDEIPPVTLATVPLDPEAIVAAVEAMSAEQRARLCRALGLPFRSDLFGLAIATAGSNP
jgi:hypothetical protein